jgi:hypothetical protein
MTDEYVSGEQYHKMQSSGSRKRPGKKVTLSTTTLGAIAVVIVLCILSFMGGTAYEKHHNKVTATAVTSATGATGFGGGTGNGLRRGGGSIGAVTAVSDTSITVTNSRTNASTTYAITSSTVITDNGTTVAASDIQTGDTVLIMTSTTDTSTATTILVNPSFGGAGGGPAANTQSTTDNSSGTDTTN